MAVQTLTPAQVGGSLDEGEIRVYHRSGPHKGSILVVKKDDAGIVAALAAGEIVVDNQPIGVSMPEMPPPEEPEEPETPPEPEPEPEAVVAKTETADGPSQECEEPPPPRPARSRSAKN